MKHKTLIISSIIGFIILIIVCFIYNKLQIRCYEKNLYYMDTYINIKIYTNDSNKANKSLKYIDNLYKTYHELSDRYNSYSNITNIYTINNNVLKDEYLTIDKKLYKLISYGKDLYNKSNGKIDISMGNVIDIWKGYRESQLGIPSINELKYVNYNSINDIILKDNNKIKNNNLNLDLGCFVKGYVTALAGKYLKNNGLNKFIINAGGNVLTGEKVNDLYKIGLENPDEQGAIYNIVKVENKAVVTSGGYLRYYEYNGKKYHHIIDPDTLYPPNYMKSVTVITDDSGYADFMSTYLYLLPVDDGLKIVNNTDNLEAIWYVDDNNIVKSKGFNKYES